MVEAWLTRGDCAPGCGAGTDVWCQCGAGWAVQQGAEWTAELHTMVGPWGGVGLMVWRVGEWWAQYTYIMIREF